MLTERPKALVREENFVHMYDKELEMFYQYLDRVMVAKEMGDDSSKMPIASFYKSDEKLNLEVETMVTLEMTQALSELNQANYQAAMKFIRYLLSTQSKQETSVVDTSKRFGISQGNLQVPDDIDFCNDEIADLFGVK